MLINQNVMALAAHHNLSSTQRDLGVSLEERSSDLRITRTGDGAGDLVIGEPLRVQMSGMSAAIRHAQDGVSVVQTAEGALTEVHSMLQRIRDLAVDAANEGANGGFDGGSASPSIVATQREVDQLTTAIDEIATTTSFNSTALLTGGATLNLTIGATNVETISVATADTRIDNLVPRGVDFTLASGSAKGAIPDIDAAIAAVADHRGLLGAVQNRLEQTIGNLRVATENLAASESRIRDVDMAAEMTRFTRNQILSQASTAMLAQANSVPQGIVSLLN